MATLAYSDRLLAKFKRLSPPFFKRLIGIACCCLLSSLCLLAQNARPPDQADQAEINELIALEKMWNQIQLLRDSKALDKLIGERFVGTYPGGHFARKAEFLADIHDSHHAPTTASIQDLNVELYGRTAIVTGSYHTHGTDHGKLFDEVGRFTDTWTKRGTQWECVASHASLMKNRK